MVKQTGRVMGDERSSLTSRLRTEYEAGASIRELAESTGRSYGFVHRILSESGVTLRGRGGPKRATAA
jgi:predicted transcriptional regulator